MRFVCILSCMGILSCAAPSVPPTYQFDRLTVTKNPTKVSTILPRSFFPEEYTLLFGTELRSSFSNIREVYVKLETTTPVRDMEQILDARVKLGDWKLVEKKETDTEIEYLLEGFLKKSLTIILKDEEAKSQLIYFFRKQTSY